MIASILCPGPSIRSFVRDEHCGLTIGVNRAATLVSCDVYAATDYPAVMRDGLAVIGTPMLLTAENAAGILASRCPWRGEVFLTDKLKSFIWPAPIKWDTFSVGAAIVYAASVGATAIHCYGMDWAGTEDWDGTKAGMNRTPDRWQLERGIFHQLEVELSSRSVVLTRIQCAALSS